jgi:HlyD family secretion protein
MKKIWIVLGILAILIVFLWIRHKHDDQPAYITALVKQGPLVSYVEETGTLNPLGNTTVSGQTITGGITVGAQVTGLIKAVYVDFNSHVKKGQILALIDPKPYEDIVKQDEADVVNAEAAIGVAQTNVLNAKALLQEDEATLNSQKAQMQKDEATLQNDKINYNREKILVAQNYDSRQNLDNALYAYKAQEALVRADQAQINQAKAKILSDKLQIQSALRNVQLQEAVLAKAQAALSQAKTNLSYTRIVSPVDGIVIDKEVAVGQTVVSSFQSPNLFVLAQSLKKMQIDTLVDEADIGKIHVGQEANFNVDAYPNQTFHGKVMQIRQNPINQQNVVDYDVIVSVSNPDEKLYPGMTADVKFIVASKKNALKIPNEALRFVPPIEKQSANFYTPSQKYRPHVWVLENGQPVKKDVVLGFASDTETEVLKGLKQGEQVIVGIKTSKSGPRTLFF